jgi:acetyl/propionyl-CoA carboxylase alpha subunit
VDSGVEEHGEIGVYYDPMIAKLIVRASDRQRGLARMARALREFLVLGVKTSIPLHRWLMAHPDVRSGQVDTGWLERTWSAAEAQTLVTDEEVELAAIAAALLVDGQRPAAVTVSAADGRGRIDSAWRLSARQAALR